MSPSSSERWSVWKMNCNGDLDCFRQQQEDNNPLSIFSRPSQNSVPAQVIKIQDANHSLSYSKAIRSWRLGLLIAAHCFAFSHLSHNFPAKALFYSCGKVGLETVLLCQFRKPSNGRT